MRGLFAHRTSRAIATSGLLTSVDTTSIPPLRPAEVRRKFGGSSAEVRRKQAPRLARVRRLRYKFRVPTIDTSSNGLTASTAASAETTPEQVTLDAGSHRLSARAFVRALVTTWLPPTCPLSGDRVSASGVLSPSMLDAINLDASLVDDDGVGAIFEYGGPLAELIRQAKFHPDESAARALTTLWSKEAAQHIQTRDFVPQAIAYVPAHWRRRSVRGFDLPALLAQGLAHVLGVPVFHGIQCTRFLAPLSSGATREERTIANRGRFTVTRPPPNRLVVVDDVVTTGATIAAVRNVLEQAGSEVCSLLLARTERLPSNP